MGGIAEYTGSLVCQTTLGLAASVALSPRNDRDVQVFSFNLLDENQPFTARIPLDALASVSADALRADLAQAGRRWVGYFFGCLCMLHQRGLVELANPQLRGLNLAVLSTVPMGAGVGSSAAIEVAVMLNLLDHFGVRDRLNPLELSSLCQQIENRIVGAPCGIMDPVACCLGRERELLRLLCQPHELSPGLPVPPKIRVVGIHSAVRHPDADARYARTRCAAFMGHAMILRRMRDMAGAHAVQPSQPCSPDRRGEAAASGASVLAGPECQTVYAAGRPARTRPPLGSADPMRGYLANLDQDDYKSLFRPLLPEVIKGSEFLDRFGGDAQLLGNIIWPEDRHPARIREGSGHEVESQMLREHARHDSQFIPAIDPDTEYHVQQAADHHVLEARRVRQFVGFLEQAARHEIGSRPRMLALDKAGHLMYASHISYANDALLGAPECDLLVKLVRDRERAGFYGARITGRGCGGMVAVLCNESDRTGAALEAIMAEYQKQTGKTPSLLAGTSPGAWHVGTALVYPTN
jgi:L-arabinokinase